MHNVTINGKQYEARYSMRVLRTIVAATGCGTIEELGEKISSGDPLAIITIIHEGVKAAGATITRDELEDEFQSLQEITDALAPWREWFAGFFTGPSGGGNTAPAATDPTA